MINSVLMYRHNDCLMTRHLRAWKGGAQRRGLRSRCWDLGLARGRPGPPRARTRPSHPSPPAPGPGPFQALLLETPVASRQTNRDAWALSQEGRPGDLRVLRCSPGWSSKTKAPDVASSPRYPQAACLLCFSSSFCFFCVLFVCF